MAKVENLNKYNAYIKNDQLVFEKKGPIPAAQRFFGRIRGRSYDSVKVADVSFEQKDIRVLQQKLSEVGEKEIPIELVQVIFSEKAISEVKFDTKIEKLLGSIQKKLGTTSPLAKRIAEVKERVSLRIACETYGLPESLLETDYDSVRFLLKSRLLYTIKGFENTSDNGKSLKIKDGKIYIPINGVQTPVQNITNRFSYDPVHIQLVEKETNLPWNYLLPEGLIQKAREGDDELLPAIKLTKKEREQLLEHAKKNKQPEFKKDEEPTCVLQISTNPPERLGKVGRFPLMHGFQVLDPVHIGFRIIDQEGNVYSTGFLTTDENQYKKGIPNLFASVNGKPGLVDYDEFRPFKGRFVTSVPMTQSTCEGILERVNEMRARGVRFNQGTQNCTSMALDILQQTGINIDNKLTRLQAAKALLPHMASFPVLNKIFYFSVSLSEKIAKKTKLPTLGEAERIFDKTVRLILTPIRVIDNIIFNTIMLVLGGGKGTPVPANVFKSNEKVLKQIKEKQDCLKALRVQEKELETNSEHEKLAEIRNLKITPLKKELKELKELKNRSNKLHSFKYMINSPLQIFSSKPTTFSHSGVLIAWQVKQESTLFYTYNGPNMTVLPKEGSPPSKEQKAAHERLGNKEVVKPTVWGKVAKVISKPTEWV